MNFYPENIAAFSAILLLNMLMWLLYRTKVCMHTGPFKRGGDKSKYCMNCGGKK